MLETSVRLRMISFHDHYLPTWSCSFNICVQFPSNIITVTVS